MTDHAHLFDAPESLALYRVKRERETLVNLLRQARGYVADHVATHPGDVLAARLWSEIDGAIDQEAKS